MRAVRNPVVVFLAVAVMALVLIAVVIGELASRAAKQEAISDARDRTGLLAHSVAEPAVPRGLVKDRAGAIDRFDRKVLDRLLVTDVDRVKIWDAHGRIVYSDETRLIGQRFGLDEDELEILHDGGSIAEVSDLTAPENRFERKFGGLLEVYTQIRSPEGQPLLFEVYYSADKIAARQHAILDEFTPITLGGLVLVVLVATGLLWALTRRLQRSADDRERLLRAAVDASDAERVRIARDLHDGVVQDLVGATFTVSALARSPDVPDAPRAGLDKAGQTLRTSLRSLRSLMVEIYPPDLHARGLGAALEDLLAPAAAQGIEAQAHVDGVEGASDDTVALVWRVAQEAIRNALRHSRATRLEVSVTGSPERVVLEVSDDGRGFDTSRPARPESFGLRGLEGLIADAGGRLDIRSAPGAGTTVHLEVGGGEE